MSYKIQNFVGDIALTSMTHRWNANRAAELNAIATALSSDTITHSTEMATAPAGLQPGQAANTRFTNAILLTVNKGRAGNLTASQMSNGITGALSQFLAPVNTTIPAITGTGTVGQTLTCTTGIWTYVPTEYTYQWMRGPVTIVGATQSTYLLVAADSGQSLTCQLTAYNAAGSTMVTSSAKAVS